MKIILRLLAAAVLLFVALGGVFYADPLAVQDQLIRFSLWRQGVHSRYVEVGGYRIHYFEAGPPDGVPGTPLLLVHGLGSRGEDWAALIAPLAAKGFHVYVPDLLGYGRSPRPNVDYSISLEESLMVQFLHAIGVPRADVGGWSMGGWVAAKLTLDHPELVDRLILYDSAGIYFPATFDATLFTPTDHAGLTHLMEMLQPTPEPMPEFIAKSAVKRLRANAWVVERSVDAMTGGRDLLDFRLSGMQRPTLIVWGSKDVLIPPSVAESMHHLIPNSSFTLIDGCGHLAPAQCPQSALAATVAFLRAQPPLQNVEQTLPGR